MHRRERESVSSALDPQDLTFTQKVSALLALGRVPLASEVPLWCFFGCLLSSQIFSITDNPASSTSLHEFDSKSPNSNVSPFANFDILATLQCVLIVWGTNLSINYGNEYFDYDLDRPGMVGAIMRDLRLREQLRKRKEELQDEAGVNGFQNGNPELEDQMEKVDYRASQENDKIMGSTTRIIHDGTFPPYVALVCSCVIQLLLLLLMISSRHFDNYDPTTSNSTILPSNTCRISPFRGLALHIGLVCTFLSQTYVGPPLRLHYHGWGEIISALLLSPISALFGLIGHYTAVSGRPLTLVEFSKSVNVAFLGHSGIRDGIAGGFDIDAHVIILLLAFYFFEQARILIMHIQDIEADKRGAKITMTVRLGFTMATRLYIILNIISVSLFALVGGHMARVSVDERGQSEKGRNSLLRIAGSITPGSPTRLRAISMLAGISLVMGYAIPIMSITAKSLLFIDPSRRAVESSKNAQKSSVDPTEMNKSLISEGMRKRLANVNGVKEESMDDTSAIGSDTVALNSNKTLLIGIMDFIPVLPHKELAKIVSIQTLLTPIVLSLTLALGTVLADKAKSW